MDRISLALGITGTGGVIVGLVAYLVSKGIRSKCLAAKMEMSFDVHKVDKDHERDDDSGNSKEKTLKNLTRSDLEDIIIEVMNRQRRSSCGNSVGGNIIIPNILQASQPSLRELEEMIKESIHDVKRGSPHTRSRSGSEESHRSHKSQHSRCKDDHIVILKEEL